MRWLAFLVCWSAYADVSGIQSEEFFEKKIRPILVSKCFGCHTNSKLGGPRLDFGEAIMQGGQSGAAPVPGEHDRSLLIQAISRTHERLKMPRSGPLELHATLLHLMGLDHKRLTYRYSGRDYRLTDVAGTVLKTILA